MIQNSGVNGVVIPVPVKEINPRENRAAKARDIFQNSIRQFDSTIEVGRRVGLCNQLLLVCLVQSLATKLNSVSKPNDLSNLLTSY